MKVVIEFGAAPNLGALGKCPACPLGNQALGVVFIVLYVKQKGMQGIYGEIMRGLTTWACFAY